MSQDFIQRAPRLENPFSQNLILKSILSTYLTNEQKKSQWQSLEAFGQRIINEVHTWGRDCETHPPEHIPYSSWGERVDEIRVHESWNRLASFAAQEGLIADGYQRIHGENSRLLQMAKLFLYHPSSAFFSCPLAMTDGAAKVLEMHKHNSPFLGAPFENLTSKDPGTFWTSGQWMTEKTGGSDVSATSTLATPKDDHFLLSGIKWFSSSTTSQMALGLARVKGDQEGSRGLSLFFVPMRTEEGALNNITVHRLKDKMGTKGLPTAELTLNGTKAWLIGERGKGVKTVATMLNITRMYNSVCSVAQMDRALHLLTHYAYDRVSFSKSLIQHPLFQDTLAHQKMTLFASMSLTFELCHLLGKEEMNSASEEEQMLLRLLTPITKLYTAKQSVWVTSECLEGFGGAGYIEDTEIPVLFRDAQVFPIWEGATNVLSLDVLRVMKDPKALMLFFSALQCRLESLSPTFPDASHKVLSVLGEAAQFAKSHRDGDLDFWQTTCRDFSWSLGEIYAAILMLEHAQSNAGSPPIKIMAERWAHSLKFLSQLKDKEYQTQTRQMLELS